MALADYINQAGDRINGALDERRALALQDEEKAKKEADMNRVLHPATQKWLSKVLTGEMDPVSAAAAAHQEIDYGTPSGPPMPMDVGVQGPASTSKLIEPGEQGAGIQSSYGAPARPAPAPRPAPRLFTQRDVGDLNQIAPFASAMKPAAALTYDQRVGLEGKKGEEARKTVGVKTDALSAIKDAHDARISMTADKRLAFDYYDAMLKHQDRLDALMTELQKAREGHASAKDVAVLQQNVKIAAAEIFATAKNTSSINSLAGDPNTQQAIDSLQKDVANKLQILQSATNANPVTGPGPSVSGSKSNPSGTPNIPKSSSSSRTIRVRLKNGQSGSIPESSFDPASMTKL